MTSQRTSIISWCLYDVGNSAFATTIMAVIFPVYFQKIIASTITPSTATAYWGYASSSALLISAILAPFIGIIADLKSKRKNLLFMFTLLGVTASALMATLNEGEWFYALLLLAIGTVGFSASTICYDSLLPHIAPVEKLDSISTMGYGLGYLGGGTLLAINIIFIKYLPSPAGTKLSFISVAIWWIIFTLPLMANIKEPQFEEETRKPTCKEVRTSLIKTFKDIRQYQDTFTFLIAFWFFNDGIGTVIRMAAIFGAQVGISETGLVMSLLVTQFIGIPSSIIIGIISQKVGSKRTLSYTLICYIFIALGAYFLKEDWHFWVLAISVGLIQGGAQAISRSIYASMIPQKRSAEFFGFYDISSKFAGIAGPAIFGIITQITKSSRPAIIAVGFIFTLGLIILKKVDVDRGRKNAQNVNLKI